MARRRRNQLEVAGDDAGTIPIAPQEGGTTPPPPAAGGSGDGDGDPGVTDVFYGENRSSSGLPTWGAAYVKNMLRRHGNSAFRDYRGAIDRLDASPALIEQQRVQQNRQWGRDIQQPMYDSLKTGINSLAGRGMVNSSISGDWMSRITQNALNAARKQQTDSNVWASGQQYQNLRDMIAARGGFAGTLRDLLDSSKLSSSSGSTPVLGNLQYGKG